MNTEAKIWNTTKTGHKVHAFENGVAVCRSSIKDTCPAPAHTKATARRWVLDTPGLGFCVDCDHRFDFLVKQAVLEARYVENAHAEALEMNAQYDANLKETNDMADEARDFTGPLSPLQMRILKRLVEGDTHEEIADKIECTRSRVTNIVQAIVLKMGCKKSSQAIARYSAADAYVVAAELIEADRPLHPESDEVDQHVWHVLDGLAKILRDRAAKLLPQ